MYRGAGHHTNYIYRGVMDFYLSLWLYAMYSVCTPNRIIPINFDEFHFYYASMVPMYFFRADRPVTGLASLILGEATIGAESMSADKFAISDQAQRQLRTIFDAVMDFWNTSFRQLCFQLHQNPFPGALNFFISPPDIVAQRTKTQAAAINLDIQSFCNLLTPYWYWFHFKHITIPVITASCNDFRAMLSPLPAKSMWFQWCQVFGGRVRGLNVRFHMEQRRLQVKSL